MNLRAGRWIGYAEHGEAGAQALDEAAKHGITMEIADERRESDLAYLVG